jgi:hypothetical protein
VTANYFAISHPQVPITHLLGILIFHGVFLLFGFASAGAPKAVFVILLLQGRGIGAYPIDEGVGPPDWLLKKTEGARTYPHNIHLEMLYETGIVGLLIYTVLTLLPLAAGIKYWPQLSVQEKLVISIYFFYFVSQELSGAFAVSYDFQLFLGTTIGIIGLKRKETWSGTAVPAPATSDIRGAAPAIDAPGRTN